MSPTFRILTDRRHRSKPALVATVACVSMVAWIRTAGAQGAAIETPPRADFVDVWSRFDGRTVALIVAAVVVVALLLWRVLAMVRRERRPTVVPQRRAASRRADEGPDSLQRPTDWGFDQNKRAAQARSAVVVESSNVDLPSLDAAVTQWSISDVHNAVNAGVMPDDSLGKSPLGTRSPYRTSFNPYFKREQPVVTEGVVEVADALMQAELLVRLGDPKQAMTLLSRHIRETEKPGPAAWLMLLNLYQSTGREKQYNALSAGFRTLFNADVPPWADTADAMARDIESYPQVLAKVQAAWSGPTAHATLETFLNDDRGGSRQGFSLAAYGELLFLSEVVEMLATIAEEERERIGIRRKLAGSP